MSTNNSATTSSRDGMNIKDYIHVVASMRSQKVCPVCIEAYKVNEDISWSKNENCYHAFHLDYIMDWLMENDYCPMCRWEYFLVDDNV